MSEPDQPKDVPVKVENQLPFQAPPLVDGAGIRQARRSSGILVPILGIAVIACLAVIAFTQFHPESAKNPQDADDLGAGVATGSGLRGHLVTRWQQGKTQYMLKIEPLDARNDAGFAAVTANPTKPISINIRLLDSAGFALCGKEIVLRYDPLRTAPAAPVQLPKKQADAQRVLADRQASLKQAAAQETAREQGKDTFQNIQGSDGSVEALWAQGELPCSPDQYKRFDYWDLSTNFPIIAEQEQLLGHRRVDLTQVAAAESRAASEKRKLAAKKPTSTFFIEGDDRVTAFEPSRNLLVTPGRSFLIPGKNDQAVVAEWASDSTLIHFKCDQQSNCALRTVSHPAAIYGRVSN